MKPNSNDLELIAELANAHQGSLEGAIELAEAAIEAGADAIKFQMYLADELLTPNHHRYQHFKGQAFSLEQWDMLLSKFCEKTNVYADIFGFETLDIAKKSRIAGIKIHSSDLTNIPLIEAAAKSDKKIILSVGGSTEKEIAEALALVLKHSLQRPSLFFGFQTYPTQLEDTDLAKLRDLITIYSDRADIGFMDHVAGDSDWAIKLPLVALGVGATIIEKHITLNREAKGVDYYSSVTPQDFKRLSESIDEYKSTIGTGLHSLNGSAKKYRSQVQKHWVASRPIKRGETLNSANMVMKRTPTELPSAIDFVQLDQHTAMHDISENQQILRTMVRQKVWAMIVARSASSRLPEKAFLEIAGKPTLSHLIGRVKQSKLVDQIVLCTTLEPEDRKIYDLGVKEGIMAYRGPVEDVLGRMHGAIGEENTDLVIRITGDDILIDPNYLDRAIEHHLATNAQYTDSKGLPSGTEVEVFDYELLKNIHDLAEDRSGTEYLTWYVTDNQEQIRCSSNPVKKEHCKNWRLTLDTKEDFEVIKSFLVKMDQENKLHSYRYEDIIEFFSRNPQQLEHNRQVKQRVDRSIVNTRIQWQNLVGRG